MLYLLKKQIYTGLQKYMRGLFFFFFYESIVLDGHSMISLKKLKLNKNHYLVVFVRILLFENGKSLTPTHLTAERCLSIQRIWKARIYQSSFRYG